MIKIAITSEQVLRRNEIFDLLIEHGQEPALWIGNDASFTPSSNNLAWSIIKILVVQYDFQYHIRVDDPEIAMLIKLSLP